MSYGIGQHLARYRLIAWALSVPADVWASCSWVPADDVQGPASVPADVRKPMWDLIWGHL